MNLLSGARFEFLQTSEPNADGIVVVTVNRPQALNALPFPMFDEVTHMAKLANHGDAVRAVFLTGAGRGFCAGADLSAITDMQSMRITGASSQRARRRCHEGELHTRIRRVLHRGPAHMKPSLSRPTDRSPGPQPTRRPSMLEAFE